MPPTRRSRLYLLIMVITTQYLPNNRYIHPMIHYQRSIPTQTLCRGSDPPNPQSWSQTLPGKKAILALPETQKWQWEVGFLAMAAPIELKFIQLL